MLEEAQGSCHNHPHSRFLRVKTLLFSGVLTEPLASWQFSKITISMMLLGGVDSHFVVSPESVKLTRKVFKLGAGKSALSMIPSSSISWEQGPLVRERWYNGGKGGQPLTSCVFPLFWLLCKCENQ